MRLARDAAAGQTDDRQPVPSKLPIHLFPEGLAGSNSLTDSADVIICGAGIAGVSTAYHLAVERGLRDVLLVDERAPLSLTSDKSTECYRNWWPGPGDSMVRLMNRSIDLLETWADRSGNPFHLNRRGYLFATARREQAEVYRQSAEEISALGAGPLRIHRGKANDPPFVPAPAEGYRDLPTGADLLLDQTTIQRHFPYLSEETVAVLHPRRCGWFSAQQLGRYLLQEAQAHGARLVEGKVEGVRTAGGRVSAVQIASGSGNNWWETDRFVLAAGPKIEEVARLLGQDLPVYCELHSKVSIPDREGVVPRDAPLTIWSDAQHIPWSQAERDQLAADPELAWLLKEFPAGVHTRPDGPEASPIVLMLWTYDTEPMPPTFPPPYEQELYPEITLRGLSAMIPGFKKYFQRLPQPYVDGGYYVKTQENRPLIGPLEVGGTYVIGALSGYGLMASPAAGELAAAHITGSELPSYQSWFRLERYQDPEYEALLEDWGSSGQL